MGVIAKGIPRGCQDLFTPVSLGYPLSVFNQNSTLKRRTLGNYFSKRICYKFQVSKCRGDQDLGLCTTSVLAFGDPQRNSKIRFFLHQNRFFFPDLLLCHIIASSSFPASNRLRHRFKICGVLVSCPTPASLHSAL